MERNPRNQATKMVPSVLYTPSSSHGHCFPPPSLLASNQLNERQKPFTSLTFFFHTNHAHCWSECLYPPKIHILKLNFQYTDINKWAFGRWMGPKKAYCPIFPEDTRKALSIKNRPSLDTKPAGALILDFPDTKTMNNKFLLSLNSPDQSILLQQPRRTRTSFKFQNVVSLWSQPHMLFRNWDQIQYSTESFS